MGDDLEDALSRGRRGDASAAARFYDLTCADAWQLARLMKLEPNTARRVLVGAYREALEGSPRDPTRTPNPRGWLLSLVFTHAKRAR